jgi:hypothetical protein
MPDGDMPGLRRAPFVVRDVCLSLRRAAKAAICIWIALSWFRRCQQQERLSFLLTSLQNRRWSASRTRNVKEGWITETTACSEHSRG